MRASSHARLTQDAHGVGRANARDEPGNDDTRAAESATRTTFAGKRRTNRGSGRARQRGLDANLAVATRAPHNEEVAAIGESTGCEGNPGVDVDWRAIETLGLILHALPHSP